MATTPTKTTTAKPAAKKPAAARKPATAKAAAAKKPVTAKAAPAKKPAAPRKTPAKKPAKSGVPVGTIAAGAAAVAVAGGAAYAANKLGKDGITDLAKRGRKAASNLVDRGIDGASDLATSAKKSVQGLIDKAQGKPAKPRTSSNALPPAKPK